jgi:hypothetical protein
MRAAADGKIPDFMGLDSTLYTFAGGRARRARPVALASSKLRIYLNHTKESAHDRQQ